MAKKKGTQKKTVKSKPQNFSTYIKRFWIIFGAGVFAFFFMFLLASWGLLGEMPDHTILENPKTFLATLKPRSIKLPERLFKVEQSVKK